MLVREARTLAVGDRVRYHTDNGAAAEGRITEVGPHTIAVEWDSEHREVLSYADFTAVQRLTPPKPPVQPTPPPPPPVVTRAADKVRDVIRRRQHKDE